MKKATLIIAMLALLSLGILRAEEGLQDEGRAISALPASSFMVVDAFTGTKSNGGTNPVHLLPGMSRVSSPERTLPQSLITDLTNAPNPFDSRHEGLAGQTQISYRLIQDAKVSVEIYTLLGYKVRGWDFAAGVNGGRLGSNTLLWDGTNQAGQKVSKGGYLAEITIETPQTTVTAVRKIGIIH